MPTLDAAFDAAKIIARAAKQNEPNIRTEEDSKIQLINRFLTESLGWHFQDIGAERKHDNGFSDYLLSDCGKPVLVLEAKRKDELQIATTEVDKVRHLKIAGPGLQHSNAGIDQACKYAISNGLQIATLTDGFSWIVFRTFVPGENFKSKEAIVFPSLNAVINHFSLFYDLISKDNIGKKLHVAIFDTIHQKRLLLSQNLTPPLHERDIRLSKKPDLAFDLDQVFSAFFARLTGDDDSDLLVDCFVETRESRIADFSLEKMTASVLGNISPIEKDVDAELTSLIEQTVEIDTGQTVFIVGPTGAGKTTFLSRFFRKTLSVALQDQCLVIGVNFLDASGSRETAIKWLTETIISSIEMSIYEDGSPSWDELLGLYHSEYVRRSKGVDAHLYQQDKAAFKTKFGQYLDEMVEKDREGYLKRLLTDIVTSRKKLPIILIDNTDEFPIDYKTALFQFVQALRRHARHCLLIFPVTDKSAWSFSKTDIFGIYQSRSFFLPTPPPREVFRRRIDFLKRRLSDDIDEDMRRNYFTARGIKISIGNLSKFAQVLENIFVDHDYTSKTIGELCNYNIRRTLMLSKRIITSSVFKIEDILSSYITSEQIAPNFSKFMSALIKGDYEAYKLNDTHEIFPIFQVDSEIRQSPLLYLRILSLLESTRNASKDVAHRHVLVQSIFDYFDAGGCPESAVDRALLALMHAGLLEPFDSSVRDLSPHQRLAISFSGRAHYRLAMYDEVFFEQMALTTAIVDAEVASKIRASWLSKASFKTKMSNVRRFFFEYVTKEDSQLLSFPGGLDQFEFQHEIVRKLGRFVEGADSKRRDDSAASIGEEYGNGTVMSGTIATVDWYDSEKGFGFVDVEGVQGKVFLHAERLRENAISLVRDGDDLLCDITRGNKGLYVSKIYDIETDPTTVETALCNIIRLFPDRGYGFVRLKDSPQAAFFHYSVLPVSERDKLALGVCLEVEVGADKNGRGLQVKRVCHFKNVDR